MTSLSEHESNVVHGRGRPRFVRLLRFARPYIPLVALTLLLSFAYSGGQYARAYLIKPVIDDIAVPSAELKGSDLSGSALDILGLGSAPPEETGSEPASDPAGPALDDRARLEAIAARVSHSIVLVASIAAAIVISMPLIMRMVQ